MLRAFLLFSDVRTGPVGFLYTFLLGKFGSQEKMLLITLLIINQKGQSTIT